MRCGDKDGLGEGVVVRLEEDKPYYVSLPKEKRNDIDLNVGNLKGAICSHFVLCF